MNLPLSINHRVAIDLRGILAFYEEESGPALADRFYNELMSRIGEVQKNPSQFPFSRGDRRRVNLKLFPYHFLYRIKPHCVRILVLRHDQRNPNYGITRQ